jgi:uncharacterized protein
MIVRTAQDTLIHFASIFPVIVLTGARQTGKTVMACSTFPDKSYISLDSPEVLESVRSNPGGFLAKYPNGAVIDEAHRCPELFRYLKDHIRPITKTGLFVLISSIEFDFLQNADSKAAENIGQIRLSPFSFAELSTIRIVSDISDLLFYGSYPPVIHRQLNPVAWYSEYIMNYIERDLRHIVNVRNLRSFMSFIRSCAAHCGYLLNLSALADECGITHNTARAWIAALEAGHIVFLLRPHKLTFGRRTVKSAKLFFSDVGLAAYLLGINDPVHMSNHPAWPFLFENFVVSELMKTRFNAGLISNFFFWSDSSNNEVSIIAERGDALIPIQIKSFNTVSDKDTGILIKWRKLNKQPSLPACLIYSGKDQIRINGFTIYPWQEIGEFGPLFSGALKAYMRKN